MRIIGVDVGWRHFAVASDGYVQDIQGKQTVDSTSNAIWQLGDHLGKNADVLILENLQGRSILAQNIVWIAKSTRRRFPGIKIHKADHDFPSSSLCNKCGLRNIKTRSDIFECAWCGHKDDRDLNAAKNLRDWKIRTFAGWSGA